MKREKTMKHISKRDFIFGLVIFALVILISVFQPSNKVAVDFDADSVTVRSSRHTLNVPYDMIASAELVEKPDMGTPTTGHDDMILQTGSWQNDTWGDYEACVEIATDNCIHLTLTDGRHFIISRRDNEETGTVFHELGEHLIP